MSDDRLAEDVRLPQAASGSGRRKVRKIDVTTSSQVVQLRDPASAQSEVWFTFYSETAGVNVWLHGGPNTPTLPAATADDWPLPPQTERNFKLGAGETHIAIIGSDTAVVKAYPSSD